MNNKKIILGTVQMGLAYGVNNHIGKISQADSFLILKEAYLSGVHLLDTAEAYGDAHTVIGNFHLKNPDNKFKIITKIPSNEIVEDLERKVEKYLDDLKVKQLEALMFHSFDAYKKNKNRIPILLQLKKSNHFLQLGVSVYTNKELDVVIDDDAIDLIQLPFNLLDNVSQRGELIERAKNRNKVIHTRSVFLQGLFFKNPSDTHNIVQALRDPLMHIQHLAKERDVPVAHIALGYCLGQENIDHVLIGVDSVQQLKTNLKAVNYKMDRKTIELINQISIENVDLLNPSLWN